MGDASKIEWTDATWNPIAGCSPVSPGCTHCYAATMARRLAAMGQTKYVGTAERRGSVDVFTGVLRLDEAALGQPLRWKRPRRVFVNSMSDLFHTKVDIEWIARVFARMYEAHWHTFQVLTKRPAWMAALLGNNWPFVQAVGVAAYEALAKRSPEKAGVVTQREVIRDVMANWPLPNVWLGTSVEDQQRADERIPWLLKTPAAVRFLSCEPLLGPVSLARWFHPFEVSRDEDGNDLGSASGGSDLHWVIAGGESGHQARPMHPDWVRNLRDQCQNSGVPFFFKQWGEWAPISCVDLDSLYKPAPKRDPEAVRKCKVPTDVLQRDGSLRRAFPMGATQIYKLGKARSGRLLDGREWSEFPERLNP